MLDTMERERPLPFEHRMRAALIVIASLVLAAGSADAWQENTAAESEISFARDIRPILSDTCFKCHGPDPNERAADLRLDVRSDSLEDFITAGDSEDSELFRRIVSDDEGELMPPPDSGRKLTGEQKELLKRWIDSGAKWQKHWSFEPAVKVEIPKAPGASAKWASNEIDRFVAEKLQASRLTPNAIAERNTLIRRVCLDLTGLPPTPETLNKFSQSRGSDWYEQLVDSLIASPAYGEHMARFWLDAARYGDTHGLHLDNYREMWLYRDWIINAFNDNKSFYDFTLEQLAGDLLENPTDSQLIATGFNRAHITTNEGGSIKEEVYVRNVVDRVSTVGTVFMGLTVGCAQCHDHKYDPVSQQEFFELFAFFNSLDGNAMDGNKKEHAPFLRYKNETQKAQLSKMTSEQAKLEKEIADKIASFVYKDVGAEKPATVKVAAKTDSENESADKQDESADASDAAPEATEVLLFEDAIPDGGKAGGGKWQFVDKDKLAPFSGEKSARNSSEKFSQVYFTNVKKQMRFVGEDKLFAHVYLDPENTPDEIMLQWNDGKWDHRAYWGANKIEFGTNNKPSRKRMGDLPEAGKWVRLEVKAKDVGFKKVGQVNGIAFSQWGGTVHWDYAGVETAAGQSFNAESLADWKRFHASSKGKGEPKPIEKIFKKEPSKWNSNDKRKLKDYFLRNVHPASSSLVAEAMKKKTEIDKKINKLNEQLPTTLIWKETAKPKQAFVLERGEYDKKGEKVQRKTPAALPEFSDDLPLNRLGLAKWLLSDDHPLTARVTVNRFWQQFFGRGIVETTGDFGAQGQPPTHPELLDWLAIDFVRHDWDVKRLVKSFVMSSTYRQATTVTPEKLQADPDNRLLSRGPRYRLDAETLRDQALSISNLLVQKVGGPSVKPPQPDGLWFVVGYSGSNTVRFKKDVGSDKVHRRSLYTFWKRTAPPPQMGTFDAPSRESCTVRRERTNTPLQALLMMNDPQFIEAARHLAQLTIDQTDCDRQQKVAFMFRRAVARDVSEQELNVLIENLKSDLAEFNADKASAKKMLEIGEVAADEKYDSAELAAWTMLAGLIMNTDEFLNK